jgi:hypothetical protein
MRVGNNPNNQQQIEKQVAFHRALIPLYIPNEEDEYFRDAFTIFSYCINSLLRTSRSNLKISVISNGSSDSVNSKLLQMQQQGLIDELIIETEGIGKINSLLKALRTVEERLITITDADVLFDNGWEDAVLEVFENVPKAGAVCPVPVFRKQYNLTSNIWFKYLFSSKLKFSPVKNPEAMTKFALSIGWPRLDEKYKEVIATLDMKNGQKAVVGCSHFVATYKREVFTEIPEGNSLFKIRGNSEYLYTDLPVLKKGGYRLSTYDNYAFHMGNKLEDWMTDAYEKLHTEDKTDELPNLPELKKPLISAVFKEKVFGFLLSKAGMKKRFLKMKGLNEAQSDALSS